MSLVKLSLIGSPMYRGVTSWEDSVPIVMFEQEGLPCVATVFGLPICLWYTIFPICHLPSCHFSNCHFSNCQSPCISLGSSLINWFHVGSFNDLYYNDNSSLYLTLPTSPYVCGCYPGSHLFGRVTGNLWDRSSDIIARREPRKSDSEKTRIAILNRHTCRSPCLDWNREVAWCITHD